VFDLNVWITEKSLPISSGNYRCPLWLTSPRDKKSWEDRLNSQQGFQHWQIFNFEFLEIM
jgi:hypothetical protein